MTLKVGDLVRNHFFGSQPADIDDLETGMVNHVNNSAGKQVVRIYWMVQRRDYTAVIKKQSGTLYQTERGNIFEKVERDD